MTGNKKVQIKTAFTSEAAYAYERVDDRNTGKTNVTENTEPTITSSKTIITTKPYKVETTTASNTDEKDGSYSTVATEKPGYDTSQL
jgi:hypothetical protein